MSNSFQNFYSLEDVSPRFAHSSFKDTSSLVKFNRESYSLDFEGVIVL